MEKMVHHFAALGDKPIAVQTAPWKEHTFLLARRELNIELLVIEKRSGTYNQTICFTGNA